MKAYAAYFARKIILHGKFDRGLSDCADIE